MSRIQRSSLALPTLAASVLGAGSVVGMAMAGGIIAPNPAGLATRLNGGTAAEPVATAATAPPPIEVALPDPQAASVAQDPIRRARTSGAGDRRTTDRRTTDRRTTAQRIAPTVPRRSAPATPPATPPRAATEPTGSRFDAVHPVAARVAQPSYTVVVERTSTNRLVAVRVIDPTAAPRSPRPPRAQRAPATTWRRGTVGG